MTPTKRSSAINIITAVATFCITVILLAASFAADNSSVVYAAQAPQNIGLEWIEDKVDTKGFEQQDHVYNTYPAV